MTEPLVRISKVRPGHDCITHPCGKNGCGTHPGSNHGWSGDDWIYVVVDDDIALVLIIDSNRFNGTQRGEPYAMDISLHCTFPTDRESIRQSTNGQKCLWLGDRQCHVTYSACNAANEFFREWGEDRYEQPETFWMALEAECRRLGEDARKNRADTQWARCNHCDGLGTVAKEKK